jgi:hypothetical protein
VCEGGREEWDGVEEEFVGERGGESAGLKRSWCFSMMFDGKRWDMMIRYNGL